MFSYFTIYKDKSPYLTFCHHYGFLSITSHDANPIVSVFQTETLVLERLSASSVKMVSSRPDGFNSIATINNVNADELVETITTLCQGATIMMES
jgi:hypothetical protein